MANITVRRLGVGAFRFTQNRDQADFDILSLVRIQIVEMFLEMMSTGHFEFISYKFV